MQKIKYWGGKSIAAFEISNETAEGFQKLKRYEGKIEQAEREKLVQFLCAIILALLSQRKNIMVACQNPIYKYNCNFFDTAKYSRCYIVILIDVFVIAPCTGNTLAKLAAGITDTPVFIGTSKLTI